MDAKKGNIFEILNGYRQFIIPVYQRTYSWELSHCDKLWKDIVNIQKGKRNSHFVGSIVNVAEQVMPTGVQKFMIIDGQQRMTTLTLLLIALRNYAVENPEDTTINAPMITDMCLKNTYQQGDDRYKLLLTQSDRQTLLQLIEGIQTDETSSRRLVNNCNYFAEKIKGQEISPKDIYEAIGKLQIVNITLDRAVDDPQLIFESLNSTGMDLSQSDLIRNYILMGLEPDEQAHIYEKVWYPMERLFGYEKQSDSMDKFFRDYLTYKNGRIPNLNKIYDEFQTYHVNCGFLSIAEFSKDIFDNAVCYTNMAFAKSGQACLDKVFNEIKGLQMEVVYEKYVGTALLQKTYTVDYLTKQRLKNNGELSKYFITNNHSSIVSEEMFYDAQYEKLSRNYYRRQDAGHPSQFPITTKLICGCCGSHFIQVTRKRDEKEHIVWRCKSRTLHGSRYCLRTEVW